MKCRRLEALEATSNEPLNVAERAELLRLCPEVAEKGKDLAFLGKAATHFASKPPKQSDLR